MVPPLAPAAKELTAVRNVQLINFTGTAQSVGLIRGFKTSPIQDLKFDHCQITAQRGLMVANVQDLNSSGLALTVAQGDPIIRQGAEQQP